LNNNLLAGFPWIATLIEILYILQMFVYEDVISRRDIFMLFDQIQSFFEISLKGGNLSR